MSFANIFPNVSFHSFFGGWCRGSNPGPCAREARAPPLSRIPDLFILLIDFQRGKKLNCNEVQLLSILFQGSPDVYLRNAYQIHECFLS